MFSEAVSIGREILQPVLFMGLLVMLCYQINRYIRERYGDDDPLDEALSSLAVSMDCSVYFIFCLSGQEWNLPREKIDFDFKRYLLFRQVPYYVRHFARRNLPGLFQTPRYERDLSHSSPSSGYNK